MVRGWVTCIGPFTAAQLASRLRLPVTEVELALLGCPGVREAVVVSREDLPEDRRLVGYVVPQPGADPSPARLRSLLKEQLPDHAVPEPRDPRVAHILKRAEGQIHFETRVADMTRPFLLARGGASRIVSEDAALDFTARFPDGRWITIAGAGHNVQEDNPRDLADALRAFWGGRLPRMTLTTHPNG